MLRCQQNKYYVGKTVNPKMRLDDHKEGFGSKWTQKYPPVKMIRLIPSCDVYDEDKYTLMYMERHGIRNVRGGSYCQVRLQDYQIKNLWNQIKSATDRCHKCGKKGHFIENCNQVNPKNDKRKRTTDKPKPRNYQSDRYICYKCGEKGHLANICGVKTRKRQKLD